MNTHKPGRNGAARQGQHGATAVEFALVAMILFLLLLGIMEFGRLMFTWNSAVEATRRGARLATVCDMNVAAVKSEMARILPQVPGGDISVSYAPSGCDSSSCESVTVAISPTAPQFAFYVPLIDWSWRLPPFQTTLPRESLSNGSGSDSNPDCA